MIKKAFFLNPVLVCCIFLLLVGAFASAQDLTIVPGEAYIALNSEAEGFDLFIKAKPGLGSILITESSADPEKKLDSFAFRAWEYNSVNGDEMRILDGVFLEAERELYFLIDSTPEPNELLEGDAFHIYIPFHVTYGYPWSREGQVEMHRGTWLNIRTFELPYADYRGAWKDNPFVLSMKEIPAPPAPDPPMENEVRVGTIERALEIIERILTESTGEVDVLLVLDTTISMKDDMSFIKEALVPLIQNTVEGFTSYRFGMVLYRDYKEAYLTRIFPFTDDFAVLQDLIDKITVSGGRDLPEAMNEGLYTALTNYDFEVPERLVIQVGDAPAHPEPRGAISSQMVKEQAARLGAVIHRIRLPD